MTRRGVGIAFCIISVFLFVARSGIYYIAAAIISNRPIISGQLDFGFELLSPPYPHVVWIIPLIIGIAYLVWAELSRPN